MKHSILATALLLTTQMLLPQVSGFLLLVSTKQVAASAFGVATTARTTTTTTALKLSYENANAATICPEIPLTPSQSGLEMAIIACGWFWHPQPEFQAMPGVTRCVVGYSGGDELNPTYQSILDHTEAMLVEYNPEKVSYAQILQKWKDIMGYAYPSKRQYRSAIFYLSPEQRETAQAAYGSMKHLDIEPATRFYRAEEYHQDFLAKQRGMY